MMENLSTFVLKHTEMAQSAFVLFELLVILKIFIKYRNINIYKIR